MCSSDLSLFLSSRLNTSCRSSGDARVTAAAEDLQEVFNLDDKIKLARLRKLELENAELEGKSVDRAKLADALGVLGAKTNALLLSRLVVELPPLLAGQDAAAIRAEMEKLHARICEDFKRFSEGWKI